MGEYIGSSGRHRRRHSSRSRSLSVQGYERKRRRSDRRPSRSISIQAASRSPSPCAKHSRKKEKERRKESFEDALRRRMAQREAGDTCAVSVAWSREDLRSGRHKESRAKWLNSLATK